MCLEHRLKAEPAATEADLLSHVQMAKEDFSGKSQLTLLEARLQQSVDQVDKVNGARSQAGQPFESNRVECFECPSSVASFRK